MREWKKCTLGDAIQFKRGYDLPSSVREEGDVPIVSSSGITDYHSVAKKQPPGVVTGRYGTIGEVFFISEPYWPLNTTLYVKDFKKNDPRFISYFLKVLDIKGLNAAGAVPGVNRNHLHKIKINLPPLPTQRKIAAVLSAYDDLIENNLRRIALLEERARLVYEEWFVRLRFPGWEGVAVDGGTGLPVGWRRVRLGSVTAYVNRGIAPKYVEEDGIMVINQRCIRDKRVNLELTRLSSKAKKVTKEKFVKPFDILINSTGAGTLGRVAQIIEVPEPTTVDTHVTIVRAKKDIPAIFLGRVVDYFEDYIGTLGLGATNQTELSRKDIKRLIQFNVPTQELMNKFDQEFRPGFLLTASFIKQNVLLREARDLLLPRLMGGVVEV